MSLTPRERKVLATLADDLRVDDPGLAASLTDDGGPSAQSSSRPGKHVWDEIVSEWHGLSPAIRMFFYLLPIGLVLSVVGAAAGLLWMQGLGTLAFLSATGCTVYETRARHKAR